MSHFQTRVKELLDNVPRSWHGTTYPNDGRFVGRQRFFDEMLTLLNGSQPIQESFLDTVFPEDYLRVGSPLTAILELVRAVEKGYPPSSVFSFASTTLPLITVLLVASASQRVYVYGKRIVSEEQEAMLKESYGCDVTFVGGEPQNHGDSIVLQVSDCNKDQVSANVDAVIDGSLLYLINTTKIPAEGALNSIHTMRKRLGCPPPTDDAIAMLRGVDTMQAPDTTVLKQHLKELGGCGDAGGEVLIATVGLSALGACVMAAVDVGERDINVLMCSTAYGGSSQQTDILSNTVGLEKHTFHIQGVAGDVFTGIKTKLEEMASFPVKPLLFIQLEYPTNPDMKDCDISKLEEVLKKFSAATGSKVVLMMDTTFSPQSQSAKGFKDVPVIVFNSLSKSVSGGFTTGGSLVGNHHPIAQQLLAQAHKHLALFDTGSKGCQLKILSEMHSECEVRVAQAHENCIVAAAQLEECVHKYSGERMKVNFVTDTQRANNVTPATFSFNLPAPSSLRTNHSALESLAQSLVDKLVEQHPKGIKPCVSFGQKNTYVYATVPATSTQGVISEEDKAKQAVGGVQLVRFSFPPSMDMTSWNKAIDAAIEALYTSASKM